MALDVDVVVCTRDRPADLRRCLESVCAQVEGPREVIVCDSGTAPWSAPAELPVRVVRAPAGLPRQRNVASRHVRSDLVAFLDDDVELSPTYLQALRSWFVAAGACVGASGCVDNDRRQSPLDRIYRAVFGLASHDGKLRRSGDGLYLHHPNRPQRVDFLSGCNMVYRREVIEALRFDENLDGYANMEDLDFSLRTSRLGELWMVSDAHLKHHQSPVQRLKRADYARQALLNAAYLFGKHEAAFSLRRTAFGRRIVGRVLAYALLGASERSARPLLSAVSVLPQLPSMARKGQAAVDA